MNGSARNHAFKTSSWARVTYAQVCSNLERFIISLPLWYVQGSVFQRIFLIMLLSIIRLGYKDLQYIIFNLKVNVSLQH